MKVVDEGPKEKALEAFSDRIREFENVFARRDDD